MARYQFGLIPQILVFVSSLTMKYLNTKTIYRHFHQGTGLNLLSKLKSGESDDLDHKKVLLKLISIEYQTWQTGGFIWTMIGPSLKKLVFKIFTRMVLLEFTPLTVGYVSGHFWVKVLIKIWLFHRCWWLLLLSRACNQHERSPYPSPTSLTIWSLKATIPV